MSWSVLDEDCKAAEQPNLEAILQQVIDDDDDTRAMPAERYTKSSQVFTTTTSTLGTTELSMTVDSSPGTMSSWLRTSSPAHSPLTHPSAGISLSPPTLASPGLYTAAYQPMSAPQDCAGRFISCDRLAMTPTLEQQIQHAQLNSPLSKDAQQTPVMLLKSEGRVGEEGVPCNMYVDAAFGLPSKFLPHTPLLLNAESFRGRVYEVAKDQHGCRFLQRWLDVSGDAEALHMVMSEVMPHVAELMTDQYANFLIQKLFDMMPGEFRYQVARVAAPKIALIALTPHGTFSVQKMIETMTSKDEMELIRKALVLDVVRLIKDTHGNHVIQKILQRFNPEDKQFIYDAVIRDCVSIARNKQGCCVLQRCLEYASPRQKEMLVKHILTCCLQIVQDPFGNYVVQYVLESYDSGVNDTIAIAFLPHLVHLCVNKFSSNVMEKVLRGASAPIQEMYIETMCHPDVVSRLIQDDYGNYVLQTALTISTPPLSDALIAAVRPLMPLIKNAPYAKKLEGKVEALSRKGNVPYYTPLAEREVFARTDMAGGGNHMYYDAMPCRYGRTMPSYPTSHPHRMSNEPRSASWQPS